MNNTAKRIYLASRSPRRRELLTQMGVHYDVLLLRESVGRLDVDETPMPGESPAEYVERIAITKAQVGWQRVCQRNLPRHPVLGADTMVTLDDTIFGKPASPAHAKEMLAQLSGRIHQVMTTVALCYQDTLTHLTSISEVRFKTLTDAEIAAYVATGEPLDKAGSYAIQGRGAVFISHLSGSYTGVMGLPLYETANLLQSYLTTKSL
ncbi:Maf family protein [Sulfuriferula nivalis]|uniref:dTTP/UTP pyrophosphatase n=1 Tax=Sulfuriferula nivalis TaxID=2675298 RepID=A0A809RM53_9PROT|nr:Maf family protein [Sulfuriferula nivalis]BBP01874.1 Maf-like protein [Sulfuriferula nivalis]